MAQKNRVEDQKIRVFWESERFTSEKKVTQGIEKETWEMEQQLRDIWKRQTHTCIFNSSLENK